MLGKRRYGSMVKLAKCSQAQLVGVRIVKFGLFGCENLVTRYQCMILELSCSLSENAGE